MTYRIPDILPFFVIGILILSITSQPVQAQQEGSGDEELLDALEQVFKKDYLSIGMLLQARGQFHVNTQNPGERTFSLPNARLKLSGDLDRRISYKVQGDFSSSPALLDANLSIGGENASVTIGAQKPAMSGEFLVSSAETDFVNRSRIVSILAGSRDIGVIGKYKLTDGLEVAAGIYNGTNQNLTNNNNKFYYTGRVTASQQLNPDTYLELGFNAAYGDENGTVIGNGRLPAINGERFLIGGDGRLEAGKWLLSGEFLFGDLEFDPTRVDEVMGFHATAGYRIFENVQLLGRFDYLESDLISFPEKLIIGGLNFNYTEAASVQLNYRLNPDVLNTRNQVIQVQAQIAF